jgi:hypothetical protein
MPNTPVYTSGVKYIKIAKQDSGSVDNSIELQDLTDIRIKFSDTNNAVQYNVASVTEYSTYYLYSIFPLNITSSADQEILDYKVSASDGGILSNSTLLFSTIQPGTNTLGYFDGIFLNMGNTPNVALNISFSLSQSDSTATYVYLYQFNTASTPSPTRIGDPIITFPFGITLFNSGYATLTGSFTPIEGNSYGFVIDNNSNYYNSYFVITQSYAPEASNYDIVVLEPYTSYNFYNSDCNVIQNNVDVNNINPLYMDVDFNGGQIVAQNQAAILSGNASRAQVQPWNYSYYSQISGRYVGKQQNAIALNVYTSASQFITASSYGYTGSWPGDSISPTPTNPNSRRILEKTSPGNVVIQWLDSCIYEMNWGGPGYPENVNGGGLSMGNIYLVGETRDDVAVIKPGTDIYYDILEKTFPSGSPAFQYQYANSPSLPTQLNITYPSLLLPSATYYLGSGAQSNDIYGGAPTTIGTFNPYGLGNSYPFLLLNNSNQQGIWGSYITQDGALAQSNKNIGDVASTIKIISSSLSQGEKWFLSLYSGSGNASNPSTGLPTTISGSINLLQYGYPFEISLAYTSSFGGPGVITLKTGSGIYDVGSFFSGSDNIPVGYSASKATTGFLITKAQTPTNGLTIFGPPNSNFAGAGKGYILSQYPKQVITQNIDYILKTYGNQPT